MTGNSVKTKAGLPREAFAVAGNIKDPDTWYLPHHRKSISRVVRGKVDIEETVDWEQMMVAVDSLSLHLHRVRRIETEPEDIIDAAKHLAGHYRKAGRPLPDVLAALL
jgi:hypothetical protein